MGKTPEHLNLVELLELHKFYLDPKITHEEKYAHALKTWSTTSSFNYIMRHGEIDEVETFILIGDLRSSGLQALAANPRVNSDIVGTALNCASAVVRGSEVEKFIQTLPDNCYPIKEMNEIYNIIVKKGGWARETTLRHYYSLIFKTIKKESGLGDYPDSWVSEVLGVKSIPE